MEMKIVKEYLFDWQYNINKIYMVMPDEIQTPYLL